MLAIFDTNQDISLAEINIKFTKCSNNTVAIVYSKQVVILFFECTSKIHQVASIGDMTKKKPRFLGDCRLTPCFVKRIRSKRTNRQKLNRKYFGFCAQNEKILFDIYSRST